MSDVSLSWAMSVQPPDILSGAVLLFLAASHNKKTGLCFPSKKTIAEYLHCDRKTVEAALKRLRDAGLISWETRSTPYGRSNFYLFAGIGVAPSDGITPSHGGTPVSRIGVAPSDGCTGSPARRGTKENINKKKENIDNSRTSATKSVTTQDSSPQTGMSLNRDDSSPQTGTTVVPKRGKSSPQTGTRLYQDSINTLNTSNTSITRSQPKKTIPDCPQKKLIDLYHEILPMLPSVRCMSPAREQAIRSRWQFVCQDKGFKTQEEGLNWFSEYFAFVGRSKFLTGQTQPRADGRVFRADLEWIMKANNFAKIIDWRYHNER